MSQILEKGIHQFNFTTHDEFKILPTGSVIKKIRLNYDASIVLKSGRGQQVQEFIIEQQENILVGDNTIMSFNGFKLNEPLKIALEII